MAFRAACRLGRPLLAGGSACAALASQRLLLRDDLALLREAGFTDCFAAAHGDGARRRASSVPQWTAHVADPRYRIDYAFARAMLGADFELVGAHVDTEGGGASDHFPLVIDVRAATERAARL